MKTIYKLIVGNSIYIGVTGRLKERIAHHEYLLKKGEHFNESLQQAYDESSSFEFEVIKETLQPKEDEKKFIELYRKEGLNVANVSGGAGLTGLKRSESFKKDMSNRMAGEENPQSKITNAQFYEIVELLKSGKNNSEIAEVYNLHPNYVSLIRHKRRFAKSWESVDYEPMNSNGKRAFNYETFTEIIERYNELKSIKKVADEYNIDRSVISRIVNKKVYKDYWDKYESGSTTIERAE